MERVYEAADDPTDVLCLPDGTWIIKAGARIRIRILLSTMSQRFHVALVDPLPAGVESLNPELATTGALPDEPKASKASSWIKTSWFDHQNLRDQRSEAFASRLDGGSYEYTYIARATTPGTFIVPPAKAEEMYAPETFGRSASDRVIVR